jgi:glycosyltransferase involved in cell wall biosynthesis
MSSGWVRGNDQGPATRRGIFVSLDTATGPSVAVVITFYRDDRFFPEALASVLAQTRPADEIVVVDDASPEGTNRTLAGLDTRVRVIRHDTNRGAGAARQTGADATTSALIAYLDADDVWLPTKLEHQLAAIAASPEVAGHHVAMVRFTADGRETAFTNKPARLDLSTQLRKNQALPSALMLRRDALDSVGGWRSDNALMEDWDLNIRLVAAGHHIAFSPEPLVRFRRMEHGNLSARGLRHMGINLRTIWSHRDKYLRTLGVGGTLRVVGHVVYHEGSRRGHRPMGLVLRGAGRLLGYHHETKA